MLLENKLKVIEKLLPRRSINLVRKDRKIKRLLNWKCCWKNSWGFAFSLKGRERNYLGSLWDLLEVKSVLKNTKILNNKS